MNHSKISKILIWLFFLVSLIEIIGIVTEQRMFLLVFKPLIIPTLGLAYINSVIKINKMYVLALVFSFLGDVFLLFDGSNYFMLGLSSFLLAHIAYILILKKEIQFFKIKKMLIAVAPFVLIYVLLLSLLYDKLAKMLVPVVIYGFTISTMGSVALYNYLEKKSKIALLLVIGAIFFIVSDSLIALNKFYEPKLIFPVAIMTTYVLAQYFIYRYMAKRER